ncbi:MAG: complex I NDUFA9 subunit family protein [Rhizomicrobium sp.]
MRDKIVTVFGGSGFLGRHAVRTLARAGFRIRVAVRQPYIAGFLASMGLPGQIQATHGSVRSSSDIARAVRGASAVVNMVGARAPWSGEGYRALHLDGAIMVARAAMDAGAQTLVHISTLDASFRSRTRQGRIRGQAEAAVREEFPAATILRPASAFGPDDRFTNRIAARAQMFPALLLRNATTRLQPVFAGDIGAAVAKAVTDPGCANGRTYELAGPNVLSHRALSDWILGAIERERAVVSLPGGARIDLVMRKGALSFADLGIEPASLAVLAPTYLVRFRGKGQFRPREIPPPAQKTGGISVDSTAWTG